MAYPVFTAGQRLTAALLTSMQWQTVEQGSDQVVNNSVATVNTNLILTADAGATYIFRLRLALTGDPAADAKVGWSVPSGGSLTRFAWGVGADSPADGTNLTASDAVFRLIEDGTSTAVGTLSTAVATIFAEDGQITATADGDFILQFAQLTAFAGDTTLVAASRLDYLRIG